ncbi:MAG: CDP-diacylglycerol--serine O-phosphatidyltransferase [Gammaproteobacteria bacterium]|nr:CDP-diacylglycerol--serine O-phosphatidyltransferase [Gammaproteobacteria bacterium]MCI0590621.1 CDP-diacylglycerol--serine O-phosphatidyltransferase [Gammaproteobacteria bacterium]
MENRRRGIFLLPNLFTTAALFAGFYAIVAGMNSRYEGAAIAIFIAMILDGMDGRIARLTGTQSDFGGHYDSLSDMVCFGLAPALVMYQWSLFGLGKLGWLAAFIYAAAAALRLARYNTQAGTADKRYFQGLSSPAAAALIAGIIWLGESYGLMDGTTVIPLAFCITVAAGLLMVSNIRYHSFKQLDLKGRVPFVAVLIVVLAFVFVSIEPALVLFTLFMLYALSGPVMTLAGLRKHRAARKSIETSTETDSR